MADWTVLIPPDRIIDGKPIYYPKYFRRSKTNQTRLSTMGQKFNCDLCFADIPIAENIQKIEIGGSKIADACLTCSQKLKGAIQGQIAEAAKQMSAAQQAVAAPPAQAAAPAPAAATPAPATPPAAPPTSDDPAPAPGK